MSVFREVSFEWCGTELKFVPTFALLERVENICSISRLAMCIGSGDVKAGDASRLIRAIAHAAGEDLSLEDVLQVWAHVSAEDRLLVMMGIIEAFTPEAPEGKKPTARMTVGPKVKPESE